MVVVDVVVDNDERLVGVLVQHVRLGPLPNQGNGVGPRRDRFKINS